MNAITVKVTYANGDTVTTPINATLEEARKYYLGKWFNVGIGPDDNMQQAVAVELLGDAKLDKLIAGGQAIVNDEWLDAIADLPEAKDIRTCLNRQRVGIKDQYVAWIADAAKPTDLGLRPDMMAVGSMNQGYAK